VFIPRASALMLRGISPYDNVSIETLEAASSFDKVYIEASTNPGHLKSTSGWFAKEVEALFAE